MSLDPLPTRDSAEDLEQHTQPAPSAERVLLAISSRLKDAGTLLPAELQQLVVRLTDPAVRDYQLARVNEYVEQFAYRPLEGDIGVCTPLRVKIGVDSFERVFAVASSLAARPDIGIAILERVLLNPAVIAKLALLAEHLDRTDAEHASLHPQRIADLCLKYARDDAVLRFLSGSPEKFSPRMIESVMRDPRRFAEAAVVHHWACRRANVSPFDVSAQLTDCAASQLLHRELRHILQPSGDPRRIALALSELRVMAPIPLDPALRIGESIFFQPLADPATLAHSQYLLQCFERGNSHVEIPLDLAVFDPTKRLPAEIPDEEIARVRALAALLEMTLTVHSPIIGPIHPTAAALLEDPADNPRVMKESVAFAQRIGALAVVVHIADRTNEDAVSRYREIVDFAYGMKASDGSPLRIGFENYLEKADATGARRFPTAQEHLEVFASIARDVAHTAVESGRDPTVALAHCGLVIDAAHLNLVTDLRADPLQGALALATELPAIAEELLHDATVGPALRASHFDPREFSRKSIAELHLNQNIGPIAFTLPGFDYNADLHLPVEASGTIDISGFVALMRDAGFGGDGDTEAISMVILAEQRSAISAGGLRMLYDAVRDAPGSVVPAGIDRIESYITTGRQLLTQLLEHTTPSGTDVRAICGDHPQAYEYLAGRFGLRHLIDHLERRGFHFIFGAHHNPTILSDSSPIPFTQATPRTFAAGEKICVRGTTYHEARAQQSNLFYIVVSGTARALIGDREIPLLPGTPFGEMMLLGGTPRSADVIAGPEGTTVVAISEQDFWRMMNLFQPFQLRIESKMARHASEE